MSEDHREIWLEPKCAENDPEGRVWCQHDVWPTCPECGDKSVKYVRADLYEAIKNERDELKAAKWAEKHVDTMNDMAALRGALEGSEAEIERLQAALREIHDYVEVMPVMLESAIVSIADAALRDRAEADRC